MAVLCGAWEMKLFLLKHCEVSWERRRSTDLSAQCFSATMHVKRGGTSPSIATYLECKIGLSGGSDRC